MTDRWKKDVPSAPGFYWVRKEIEPGRKVLRVAEFVGDEEIWLQGVGEALAAGDLAEWEWWSAPAETPPK